MKSWDLNGIAVAMGHPEVLHSVPQGRAIAIQLDAGRALDDHQVHEGAWLVVVSGRIRASSGDGATELGPGSMATFDPGERHEVAAIDPSRLLLLLSPWPAPDRRMDGAG